MMGGFLRPFPKVVAPNKYQLPNGVSRLDWSHPLAADLIGAWLPGVSGKLNLARENASLTPVTGQMVGVARVAAQEGLAYSAATELIVANGPTNPGKNFSLFWRGYRTSTSAGTDIPVFAIMSGAVPVLGALFNGTNIDLGYATAANVSTGTKFTLSNSTSYTRPGALSVGVVLNSTANTLTLYINGNATTTETVSNVTLNPGVGSTASATTFATVGSQPFAIIADAIGNIYTANWDAKTISKITTSGTVSTLATLTGNPTSLLLAGSSLVCCDSSGAITIISTISGAKTPIANVGSSVSPVSMCTSDGGSFLNTVNNASGTVSQIDGGGSVTVLATLSVGIYGITADASNNIYVGDINAIKKITPAGAVSTYASGFGASDIRQLAFDASGNLYCTDDTQGKVYKITPAGVASTFASGLNNPTPLVFDASGNLFVGDEGSTNLFMITPSGVVSTITVGNGPSGICLDSSGNIYTANQNANTVSKVTFASFPNTVAFHDGDPKSSSYCGYAWNRALSAKEMLELHTAPYDMFTGQETSLPTVKVPLASITAQPSIYPYAFSDEDIQVLAFDSAGNIYAGSQDTNKLWKISPDGAIATLAASFGPQQPWSIAIDSSDNVYVGTYGETAGIFSGEVAKITPQGVVSYLTTNTNYPPAIICEGGDVYVLTTDATPISIILKYDSTGVIAATYTLPGSSGNPQWMTSDGTYFYVSDGKEITKVNITTGVNSLLASFAGVGSSGAEVSYTAFDSSGNLYVSYDSSIYKVTSAGKITEFCNLLSDDPNNFGYGDPGYIIYYGGNLYVSDTGGAVYVVYSDGTFNSLGAAGGYFDEPLTLAKDANNNIYVGDGIGIISLVKLAAIPATVTEITTTTVYGHTGSDPWAIAFDSRDTLYCANFTTKTITKIDTAGTTTTFATLSDTPKSLVFDSSDNLYVADSSSIQMIAPDGTVSTYSSTAATSLAIDTATGNIYAADSNSNLVYLITPAAPNSPTTLGATGVLPISIAVKVRASNLVVIYTANAIDGTVTEISVINGSPSVSTLMTGLGEPSCVVCDVNGEPYIADFTGNKVYKYSFSHPVGAQVFNDSVTNPQGLAFDSKGYLYVADYSNNQVFRISPNGLVSGVISAVGARPQSVAVDHYDNVFTANQNDNTVSYLPLGATPPPPPPPVYNFAITDEQQFSGFALSNGSTCIATTDGIWKLNSIGGKQTLDLDDYFGGANITNIISDSDGNIYIASFQWREIDKLAPDGTRITLVDLPGSSSLVGAYALAFDSAGNLYCVGNKSTADVIKLDSNLNILDTIAVEPDDGGYYLDCIACDSNNNVYVGSSGNGNIYKIDSSGTVTTFVSGTIENPSWITIDGDDNLYVSDLSASPGIVYKITPSGVVSTYATVGNGAYGTAFDNSGNLFVCNYYDSTVTLVYENGTTNLITDGFADKSPSHVIKDSSGNMLFGCDDGTINLIGTVPSAPAAVTSTVYANTGSSPQFLAVDAEDNLYSADVGSATISKVNSAGSKSTLAVLTGKTLSGIAVYNDVYVACGTAIVVVRSWGSFYTYITGTANLLVADNDYPAMFTIGDDGAVMQFDPSVLPPSLSSIGTAGANSVGIAIYPRFHYVYVVDSDGTLYQFTYGASDGEVVTTGLGQPSDVVCDSIGNVYVSDYTGNQIWKIDPDWNQSVFATGITNPSAMSFDSAGDLYVTDDVNNRVFIISPTGLISGVIATVGTKPVALIGDNYGNMFTANNTANTISRLPLGTTPPTSPLTGQAFSTLSTYDLVIDSTDTIYAAGYDNAGNYGVYKITPDGVATNIFIDVNGNANYVALDSVNNIYFIGYPGDDIVNKIDASGNVTNISVGGEPIALVGDKNGNMYVANSNDNTVSKIDSTGTVVSTISVGSYPNALACDSEGNVYCANYDDATISKIDTTGTVVSTFNTAAGPNGLVFDSHDNLYCANYDDGNVQKFSTAGTLLQTFSTGQGSWQLACDSSDNVYCTNDTGRAISKIATDGTLTNTFATVGSAGPIAVDSRGNLYTTYNEPIYIVVLGSLPSGPTIAATTFASTGSLPQYMIYDQLDNLYVANFGDGTVSKFTPNGNLVNTFTVGAGVIWLIFDSNGVLYCACLTAKTIISITPKGVVSTYATLGVAPTAIAFDSSGILYAISGDTITAVATDGTSSLFATIDGASLSSIFIDVFDDIYVTDTVNNAIWRSDTDADVEVYAYVGLSPNRLAMDSNQNLYCVNFGEATVYKIDGNQIVSLFARVGNQPETLAIDNHDVVYVANYHDNTVTRISPTGLVVNTLSTVGTGPKAIAVDNYGNVFTTNYSAGTVSKIATGSALPANYGGSRNNTDVFRLFTTRLNTALQIPDKDARINWRHAFADRLVGAWLPGVLGDVNLASRTTNFVQNNGSTDSAIVEYDAITSAAQEGPSVNSNVQLSSGLQNDANAKEYTLVWRGLYVANPGLSLAFGIFDGSGNPVLAFTFEGSIINFGIGGTGFSAYEMDSDYAAPATLGLVFDGTRGYVTLYVNGIAVARSILASRSIPSILPSDPSNAVKLINFQAFNTSTSASYIWNKTLTDNEMLAVHLAPYDMFTSVQPTLSTMPPPPPHPIAFGGARKNPNVFRVFRRRLNPVLQLPIDVNRVDVNHPMTVGLTGAWLPGVRGDYNYAGRTSFTKYTGAGAISFAPTQRNLYPEGLAFTSNATVATGIDGTTTPINYSLFWRGHKLGSSVSSEVLFGIVQDSNHNTLALVYDGDAVSYEYGWGADESAQYAAGVSIADYPNGPISFGLVLDGSAYRPTLTLYINGKQVSQQINLANARLYMGSQNSVQFNNASHLRGYMGCLWDRALSQQEMEILHLDPYSMFIGSESPLDGIRTPPPRLPVTYNIGGISVFSIARMAVRKSVNTASYPSVGTRLKLGFTNVGGIKSPHNVAIQSAVRLQGTFSLSVINNLKVLRATQISTGYATDVGTMLDVTWQNNTLVSRSHVLPNEYKSFMLRPLPHLNISFKSLTGRSAPLYWQNNLFVGGKQALPFSNGALTVKLTRLDLLSIANIAFDKTFNIYSYTNNSAPVQGGWKLAISSKGAPLARVQLPFTSLPTQDVTGFLYMALSSSAVVHLNDIKMPVMSHSTVNVDHILQTQANLTVKDEFTVRHHYNTKVVETKRAPFVNASRIGAKREFTLESTSSFKTTRKVETSHSVQVTAKHKIPLQNLQTANITIDRFFRFHSRSTVVPILRLVDIQSSTLPLTPEPTRTVLVPAVNRLVEAAVGASSNFPNCDEGDQDIYSFDFNGRLVSGETLLNAGTWTIEVTQGNDPNPEGHIVGVPTLSGTQVTAMMGNFLANRVYQIIVVVNTSHGRLLKSWNYLTCDQVLNG